MTRISKNDHYMTIAQAVSQRSTCLKRHYGAVIVKDDEIIATGYNGSPRGTPNCCDIHAVCPRANVAHNSGNYAGCPAVHAEQNAIISASRHDMMGATIYLAGFERQADSDKWISIKECSPCPICSNMIKNAGIDIVIGTFEDESHLILPDPDSAASVAEPAPVSISQTVTHQTLSGVMTLPDTTLSEIEMLLHTPATQLSGSYTVQNGIIYTVTANFIGNYAIEIQVCEGDHPSDQPHLVIRLMHNNICVDTDTGNYLNHPWELTDDSSNTTVSVQVLSDNAPESIVID